MWVLKSADGFRISAHTNYGYLADMQKKYPGSQIVLENADFQGETANAGFGSLPKQENFKSAEDENFVWPETIEDEE